MKYSIGLIVGITLFTSQAMAGRLPCELECKGVLDPNSDKPSLISYCARANETGYDVTISSLSQNDETLLVQEQARIVDGPAATQVEGPASLLTVKEIPPNSIESKLSFAAGDIRVQDMDVGCTEPSKGIH